MKSTKGNDRNWRLSVFLSILFIFSLVLIDCAGSDQDLIDDAGNGNVKKVKTLLTHGADVSARGYKRDNDTVCYRGQERQS